MRARPVDGRATDAERQSLPVEGGGDAYASDPSACRLCGVPNAPSAHYCVNCGAILKAAGAAAPRGPATAAAPAARSGAPDLPPLPMGLASGGPSSIAPAATPADGSAGRASKAADAPTVARGERLVAWVALGVLVIAAVFFLQRIVSMSLDRSARDATPATTTSSAATLLAAPEPIAPAEPADPAPVAVAEPPSTKSLPRTETLLAQEVSEAAAARSLVPARPAARMVAPPVAAAEPEPAIREVDPPPPPVAAPEPPPVVVAQAPVRSRWDRMRDEIDACRGNFFDRVTCEHGIRARYCEGWYGRAEECPSGRTADYGN